jgi:F420H(2)-dependent quinone reductase
MTEPLPDLDVYTAATDPPAQQRYNELLIEQFRTNAGKVTGQFANLPVLLLKTIGAKTGAHGAAGLPPGWRSLPDHRLEGRRVDESGVVPQPGGQPSGVRGTAQRILRRAGQARDR